MVLRDRWTGIVTGSLMLCSPFLFEKLGWRDVAGATPRFMMLTGGLTLIVAQCHNHGHHAAANMGLCMLRFECPTSLTLHMLVQACRSSWAV
jgi:hypothetical protein